MMNTVADRASDSLSAFCEHPFVSLINHCSSLLSCCQAIDPGTNRLDYTFRYWYAINSDVKRQEYEIYKCDWLQILFKLIFCKKETLLRVILFAIATNIDECPMMPITL